MKEESKLMSIEIIRNKIIVIRGEKVMVDRDLAALYGVSTKALNQAVTRNIKRFPADFMFRTTKDERDELVTNCDRFRSLKHSSIMPRAFTEQGVAMLSSVLNTNRAVEVNIMIMRAFVLARRLLEIEERLGDHDEKIEIIFEAILQLMEPPEETKNLIGFEVKEPETKYRERFKK
jgi:hypothetical protein